MAEYPLSKTGRLSAGILPPVQQKVLSFIKKFMGREGIPPSVRDVGEAMGIKPPTALFHLRALERKGYLKRAPGKARAVEITEKAGGRGNTQGIPVVGRIAAGAPILAVENVEGSLPLDPSVVGFPAGGASHAGAVFGLRVKGNSLKGDGILDGDIAIVREQSEVKEGEIAVFILGEGESSEATMKHYRRRGSTVVLEPSNPEVAPIVIRGEELRSLRIIGKVAGVVRWLK